METRLHLNPSHNRTGQLAQKSGQGLNRVRYRYNAGSRRWRNAIDLIEEMSLRRLLIAGNRVK